MHICNTRGGWGRGFVLALSNRWSEPEEEYRKWFANKRNALNEPFALGEIQTVAVEADLWVCNMIAQDGYGFGNQARHQTSAANSTPPIRYPALLQCLTKVSELSKLMGATVHACRIGTGLAGGKWPQIEELIQRAMPDVSVTIYDL